MFEILALTGLLFVGFCVVAAVAFVGLLLKLTIKLLFLPFALLAGLFKVLLLGGLVLLAVIFAPLLLVFLLLFGLPLLVLLGVGWALAAV